LFEDKLLFLDPDIVVVGVLQFDNNLNEISKQLTSLRKEQFLPNERIVIVQENPDQYLYIDGDGEQLIELQKLINKIDIGNCFILILTANANIHNEIKTVNQDYSFDKTLFDYCIFPGEYNKKIPTYSNTACRKLWNHLYIGTDNNITPCCVANHRYPLGNINNQSIESILDSTESTQLRQWMIDGYRIKACSTCYNKEDNDIPSIRDLFEPKTTDREKITFLDVRLNNICNFKCRMCSEYFSSSIQQETIELFGKDAVLGYEKISLESNNRKTRQSTLQKLLPHLTNGVESIYFAGGEPLITEEHYNILDQLIKIKHFDIKITYNTNLSKLLYKNYNIVDYWKQFSNVSVGASIDASESVAEYVRHGTIWQDVLDNIDTIKKQTPHVNLEITSTVGWLNLENLIELQAQWVDTSMFDHKQLKMNTLIDPTYLCVTTLPYYHKERLTEKINNHIQGLGECVLSESWKTLRNFMNITDTTKDLVEFYKRTITLDQHRKESFIEVFPQFTDLFPVDNNQ
jgi:radical SAM protein with 4Fe4S-binding SPASM domain